MDDDAVGAFGTALTEWNSVEVPNADAPLA